MPRFASSVLAFAGFSFAALVALVPGEARADILSSCGNIDLSGNAQCTLDTSGGCTAKCTPLSFEASCAAELETTCSGQCTATIDAMCSASCNTTCAASCMANPGNFTCQGSCEADCDGSCQAECSSNANQSQCAASCKATCGAHCSASCTGTPPSATCSAKCEGSCSGSCTAKANLDCNVQCKSKGYASCEANLQGGCNVACTQPKGALFCDGQWVNTTNVDQCVSDLEAVLHIKVTASANGSCSGNQCTGQAQAAATCGVGAPGGPALPGGMLVVGLGIVAAAAARRARKNRAA